MGAEYNVGVGNGSIVQALSATDSFVAGIDIAELSLQKFAHFAAMCLADISHLPFKNNSFTSILMGEVLEHLQEPKLALREVNRVLDNGGCIVLSLPNKYGVWSLYVDTLYSKIKGCNPEGHVNTFSINDAKKLLIRAGFKIEAIINTAIIGSFLRKEILMKLDVRLAKIFLNYFASGWVIKARKYGHN
ncbi:MAG: class I SAM-dependent methyltransferase [Candidatus Hydrothermarchaeota archaeon]|nr:class I SAM-dependent methyltransferase [Candidatus Hydrothermarchaeota archaeon]